jgi:hypothetical protein
MINELCDMIFDNFLEQVGDYPTGIAADDYVTFKNYHNSNFEKYPALELCFSKKVGDLLVDTLVNWYDMQELTMEQFENKPNVKKYFDKFKNLDLKVKFEGVIDPHSDIDLVPGGSDDGESNQKYKNFLNKEPASHLRLLLKQAGFKGYTKMNKKQLVKFILKSL